MLTIEVEREEDGRWLAEVVNLPGVLAYGPNRQAAIEQAKALSVRVLADRLEHGEDVPDLANVFAVVPGAAGPPPGPTHHFSVSICNRLGLPKSRRRYADNGVRRPLASIPIRMSVFV